MFSGPSMPFKKQMFATILNISQNNVYKYKSSGFASDFQSLGYSVFTCFILKCLLCFFRNITDENSRNLSCYCLPLLLSHELNSLEPRLKLSSTLMTVAQYNSVNEKYIYLIVPHKYLINQESLTLINDYSLWKR